MEKKNSLFYLLLSAIIAIFNIYIYRYIHIYRYRYIYTAG